MIVAGNKKSPPAPPEDKDVFQRLKSSLGGLPPKGDPGRRKFHFSFWYFLAALFLLTLVHDYLMARQVNTIAYSQFRQYVAEKKVKNLVLKSEKITGVITEDASGRKDQPFVTVRVDDPELVKLLEANQIQYTGHYRLCVLLGGRVAEELVFGDVSTGAQNDLQRATDIARSMVIEYGMSEKLGLVTYTREKRPLYLDTGMSASSREYSEETARNIDAEVSRLLAEAYAEVKSILTEKRDKLETIARMLLDRETIQADELRRLLGEK